MSKEHKNPYRKGLYNQIFEQWRSKKEKGATIDELITFTMGLGKKLTSAKAAVTVVLSPREKSTRGDCRGNFSAEGHKYFAHKLGRSVNAGVKEPQRFCLRWRKVELKPHTRKDVVDVPQKTAKSTKAPAKVTVKADAKTDVPAEVKA